MLSKGVFTGKIFLFTFLVMILVSLPFMIWGEEFVHPLLESQENRTVGLTALCVLLLAADSFAPIPATLVIMFLGAKAGFLAGVIGGTVGMSAGVVVASWLGRAAVGRIAPKFFPDSELERLRAGLQNNLALTLACWRSVPVLAETSVVVAAAAGVPLMRIFQATLLPNFIVSLIYSVAADDSWQAACVAFTLTLVLSYALWRWCAPKNAAAEG